MKTLIQRIALALAVLPLALPVSHALAQDFPNRPIRFVIPQPPGGPTDVVARLVGQKLGERLGQPLLADNRPGAASNIGTEIAAKASKDGHTLLIGTLQHVVNPFLFPKLPFDPVKDFTPVTLLSKAQIVLVTNPDTPAKTLGDVLALAKAQGGRLTWGYAGNGGTSHLALEQLKISTGIAVTAVPYKGNAPMVADLLGGRLAVAFDAVVTSLPNIRAGKTRPIAVASLARSPLLPDVPTMTEAGQPGFEAVGLSGLFVPSGTPAAIVERLHRETVAVLNDAEIRARFTAMGLEVVGNSPKEFADYLRAESDKWGRIIRAAGIKAE